MLIENPHHALLNTQNILLILLILVIRVTCMPTSAEGAALVLTTPISISMHHAS
jgi:hypothetical protein